MPEHCCFPLGVSPSTPPLPPDMANTSVDFSADLVKIPEGKFIMGTEDAPYPSDGEGPAREIWVNEFEISKYAVSNKLFASFIESTGYQTDAERYGWSFVFRNFLSKDSVQLSNSESPANAPWWIPIVGANWQSPFGDRRTYLELLDHPVVHVSHNDAKAFCVWSGTRLPTEAEWEKASRGGHRGLSYPWGEELVLDNIYRANTWQGDFPNSNLELDGFAATSPIDEYLPNNFGIFNTIGNVWEWTADQWSARWHIKISTETRINPKGPTTNKNRYVLKGGSYLCHESYCNRYRNSARTHNSQDSSTGNMGFRCAK